MTRDPNELVYVPVGNDRYRAHLIAQTCRTEGIRVELLTSDDGGIDPHLAFLQSHRLLVHAEDAAAVRAIIAEF